MEKAPFEQRLHQRHEAQQQPQQSVFFQSRTANMPVSPRNTLHALAIAQARKQSGQL